MEDDSVLLTCAHVAHTPGVCEDWLGHRYIGCTTCGERMPEIESDDMGPGTF